jgi:hypothetical protein
MLKLGDMAYYAPTDEKDLPMPIIDATGKK